MKKNVAALIALTLTAMIFQLHASAQELSKMYVVGKAELRDNEFVSEKNKDQNGELCAVINIVTDLEVVPAFESGAGIVKVDSKPGESSLYISPGERKLTIRVRGYEPLEIILSNYGIPKIESGKVWRLKITGDKKATAVSGTGTLILTSNPTGAKISVIGLPIENAVTPYTFPNTLASTYRLKLEKNRYVSADTTMVITKDRTDSLYIVLTPTFGGMIINSNPSGAEVIIDNVSRGKTPLNLTGEANGLDTGKYTLTLNYSGSHRDAYSPYTETVEIRPGSTVTVNGTFIAKQGLLSITSNEQNAEFKVTDIETKEVVYNGRGNSNLQVITGLYRIEAESSGYLPSITEVEIRDGANQPIEIIFTDKQKKEFIEKRQRKINTFTKSIIIPGTGQLYAGYKVKGTLITLAQLATLGGAVYATLNSIKTIDNYDTAQKAYIGAGSLFDEKYSEVNKTYNDAVSASNLQKATIGAAAALYFYNIIDALFATPKIDQKPKTVYLKIKPAINSSSSGFLTVVRF